MVTDIPSLCGLLAPGPAVPVWMSCAGFAPCSPGTTIAPSQSIERHEPAQSGSYPPFSRSAGDAKVGNPALVAALRRRAGGGETRGAPSPFPTTHPRGGHANVAPPPHGDTGMAKFTY